LREAGIYLSPPRHILAINHGVMPSLRHRERSEAIQKKQRVLRIKKGWIATRPSGVRKDAVTSTHKKFARGLV
jgi:hypothetical protein